MKPTISLRPMPADHWAMDFDAMARNVGATLQPGKGPMIVVSIGNHSVEIDSLKKTYTAITRVRALADQARLDAVYP